MNDFNLPEFKRSRGAYVAKETAEYFVSLLVTDAFLAKLLTSMGISDGTSLKTRGRFYCLGMELLVSRPYNLKH